ncbi:MAG: hypothetical protein ACREMC_09940, partial [Gemmatimonadales bacterium]
MAAAVAAARTWNARVALVRRAPEEFGTAQHAAVYAAISERVYVPTLKPDFAYVHWRKDYEFAPLAAVYECAREATANFSRVGRDHLAGVLSQHPQTVRMFRLLLGFTIPEFAETCALVAARFQIPAVSRSSLGSMED